LPLALWRRATGDFCRLSCLPNSWVSSSDIRRLICLPNSWISSSDLRRLICQ
jgi:hypothetical protein